jgi:hypothetical protein
MNKKRIYPEIKQEPVPEEELHTIPQQNLKKLISSLNNLQNDLNNLSFLNAQKDLYIILNSLKIYTNLN